MSDNQLRDNAQKMLKELEEGGIVPTLRALAIRGHRQSAKRCAISRYLNETVGGTWETGGTFSIGSNEDGSSCTVDLSDSVHSFIIEFDEGEYPELET